MRIVIVALASGYFLVLDWLHAFQDPHFVWGTLLTAGYLVLSLVYVSLIIARPGVSVTRRLTAMVTDMFMISVLMYWGRGSAALLFPIYLWVTFGNGFRYGNRYLAFSARPACWASCPSPSRLLERPAGSGLWAARRADRAAGLCRHADPQIDRGQGPGRAGEPGQEPLPRGHEP